SACGSARCPSARSNREGRGLEDAAWGLLADEVSKASKLTGAANHAGRRQPLYCSGNGPTQLQSAEGDLARDEANRDTRRPKVLHGQCSGGAGLAAIGLRCRRIMERIARYHQQLCVPWGIADLWGWGGAARRELPESARLVRGSVGFER